MLTKLDFDRNSLSRAKASLTYIYKEQAQTDANRLKNISFFFFWGGGLFDF